MLRMHRVVPAEVLQAHRDLHLPRTPMQAPLLRKARLLQQRPRAEVLRARADLPPAGAGKMLPAETRLL